MSSTETIPSSSRSVEPVITESAQAFRFQQLQHEIYSLKEELRNSEDSYRSKRELLEEEAKKNENKYSKKITAFRNKFTKLADETKKTESNYKNEIVLLKEQLATREKEWNSRMDRLEQNMAHQKENSDRRIESLEQLVHKQAEEMKLVQEDHETVKTSLSKDYLTLHIQFQSLRSTTEKRTKEVEDAKLGFDRTRMEIDETLQEQRAYIQKLEEKIREQSDEIHFVRVDGNTDKEELEAILQSWMTEHQNLSQVVQEYTHKFQVVQGDIAAARDEREDTRQRMQKLGSTFETLFEHLIEEVQEHGEAQIALQEEHAAFEKTIEEKIDTTNDDFEKQLTSVQRAAEKLAEASSLRFDRLEMQVDNEVRGMASIKKELLQTFEKHRATVISMDNKIALLNETSKEIKQQSDEQVAFIQEFEKTQEEMRNILATQKTELEALTFQVQQGAEGQTFMNNYVQKTVAEQADATAAVEEKASHIATKLADLAKLVDRHAENHKTTRDDLEASQNKLEEQLKLRIIDVIETIKQIQFQANADLLSTKDEFLTNLEGHCNTLTVHDEKITKYAASQKSLEEKFDTKNDDFENQLERVQRNAEKFVEASSLRFEFIKTQIEDQALGVASTKEEVLRTLDEHRDTLLAVDSKIDSHIIQSGESSNEIKKQTDEQAAIIQRHEDLQQETIKILATRKSDLDALATEVLQGAEGQKIMNSYLQKIMAEQADAAAAVDNKASHTASKLADFLKRLDHQAEDHKNTRGELVAGRNKLEGLIELRIIHVMETMTQIQSQANADLASAKDELLTTLKGQSNTLTVHDEKLMSFGSSIEHLLQEIEKQADELNTAKQARVVIRNDMKELMAAMTTEDRNLQRQIENQAKDFTVKYTELRTVLDKHEVGQHELDDKLSNSLEEHTASRTAHDDKLQTFGSDIQQLVKLHADEENTAVKARAQINKDLQQLTDVMSAEDGKLRCLIDSQADDIKAKYTELRGLFEKHDLQQHDFEDKLTKYDADTAGDRVVNITQLQIVGDRLNASQSQIDELKGKVEEQKGAQRLANESRVSMAVNLEKLAVKMNDESKKRLTSQMAAHFSDLNKQQSELKAVLANHKANQHALETNMGVIHSTIEELKANVEKQADDHNTAKEARAVIRSDLKKIVETMHAQDGQLRRQIELQAEFFNGKRRNVKSYLAKQITAQREMEANLEQIKTTAKGQHAALSRDFGTKLFSVQTRLDELKSTVERQVEKRSLEDEAWAKVKEDDDQCKQAQEEREPAQIELEGTREKSMSRNITMAGTKGRQQRMTNENRESQPEESLTVRGEMKRNVCFSIDEELREPEESLPTCSMPAERDAE